MTNLIKNILNRCPNIKECEFFHSDNTLAIFDYKNRELALTEVQTYLSLNDSNWYGLRIVIY